MEALLAKSGPNSWVDANLDKVIANIQCLTTTDVAGNDCSDGQEGVSEVTDSILFAIDKKGAVSGQENTKWIAIQKSVMDTAEREISENHRNLSNKPRFSSVMNPGLNFDDCYLTFDINETSSNPQAEKTAGKCDLGTFCKLKELMKKSVLTPDLEQKHALLPYLESARQLKKQRRLERAKTTGDKWFNLPKGEMTNEIKNDLLALQMSSILDPKRFVKRSRFPTTPQYFQVGTIEDDPVDFYRARLPKKQRKLTVVDELLADAKFRQYNKRKYAEIQDKTISKRNKRGKKYTNKHM